MSDLTAIERYLLQRRETEGTSLFVLSQGALETLTTTRHIENEIVTTTQDHPDTTMKIDTASWRVSTSLDDLNTAICDCTKCALGATRTKFVFGSGNPGADIVVVGEAPGADEDAQGEPFVGRAGQLLTKILEAVELKRDDVYICNILKCRPPGNRTPLPEEVSECEPYLFKQIELLQPKFILALGLTAANTLLKSKFKMADIRGSFFRYRDVHMMVTYHPAALLRNPEWKRSAWEDVKLLRQSYDTFLSTGHLPPVREIV